MKLGSFPLKKLLIVLVLFSTACSAIGSPNVLFIAAATPDGTSTLSPDVDSFLNTALAPYGQQIISAGTVTPIPTTQTPAPVTATPVPTVTPTPTSGPVFNPFDGGRNPKVNVAYEIGNMNDLPGSICPLSVYTVQGLPNNYYPAFCWGMWDDPSTTAFSVNFSYCPDNVLNILLEKINSDWASKYLNAYSDGWNFSSGFRTGYAPSTPQHRNWLFVTDAKFVKAVGGVSQWWFKISTMPCTANEMSDMVQLYETQGLSAIPYYWLGSQSDVNYNKQLIDGELLMGKNALYIVAALPSKQNSIWVPAAQLTGVQVQP
jgi:hypothetical protein